ncbi:MAG: sugar transferase [Eubacterium sp.]|nr:sugar transferase [Eubacterium sp.]
MKRKRGFYEKYVKRILDIIFSLLAIIVFCWLFVIVAIVVKAKIGSPVVFKQPRPGLIDKNTGKEKIFYMYKYRTMSNECDKDGKLLPDEQRLGKFGKSLRHSSLDELLEVFNILKGDMSIIGPRPQLVRDMVFMSEHQRLRHSAKPGVSGLAQVNGRNAITWEEKLDWDLKYIEDVSFLGDLKIIIMTVKKVFGKQENASELDVTYDYGDALLNEGCISKEKYDELQMYASNLLKEFENR